jgi:GAF domain-containing protein
MVDLDAIRAAAASTSAEQVAEIVRRTGGFRWVGVYAVTPAEVVNLAWSGPAAPAHPRFPVGRGLTADAVSTGRTVVCNDVRIDPRYLVALDSTGSEIIVPVTDPAGRVVGTLDVESAQIDAFDDTTRRELERVAAVLPPLYQLPPYPSVAELGAVRDSVLRRITDHLRADARVQGAWLSGSFGRGKEDEWSDLDLHVAVEDEHLAEFLADRPARYAAVADPVLVQDEMPSNSQEGAVYQLVWSAGGVHVDWNVGPASRAAKPLAHRLLFERRPFEVVSLPAPGEQARKREARQQLTFFWAMAPIAIKLVARRESAAAAGMLGLLTDALIRLRQLTNRALDQRMPRLPANITPPVLCETIAALCREARLLEPPLRELSAQVDHRMIHETERLLQLCRLTLQDPRPARGSR